MKILATLLWLFFAGWTCVLVLGLVNANYEYQNNYGSFWSLADKTSTLAAKSGYIDQFVSALEQSNLQGSHDAAFYETPDNSFDKNFEALKTLQSRLHEIQTIDPNSLSYQQAISQITNQEQGQAEQMTGVFYGCWLLRNHSLLWSWHLAVNIILLIVLLIVAFSLSYSAFEWNF